MLRETAAVSIYGTQSPQGGATFRAYLDNAPATFLFYPFTPILPKHLQVIPLRARMGAMFKKLPEGIAMKKILTVLLWLLVTAAVLVPIVLKYSDDPVAGLMEFSESFPGHVFIEKDTQGEVVRVDLDHTRITDAGMVHLKGMPNLQTLSLSYTDITDLGLTHIKGLNNLQSLNLSNTQITDKGLNNIKGLKNLRRLNLTRTRVTDAGMVHLEGMTNLQTLSLTYTDIDDLGLTHIKELKNLKTLRLDKWTLFSETSIADLKKALPNCEIDH
ncbi:MAG: hypothetical protein CME18_10505 [Gemmatimonadetes bacterium]|nr:hypothetical protein [Gemmatimonadota bacterium]